MIQKYECGEYEKRSPCIFWQKLLQFLEFNFASRVYARLESLALQYSTFRLKISMDLPSATVRVRRSTVQPLHNV
jgi:hypothetical protein